MERRKIQIGGGECFKFTIAGRKNAHFSSCVVAFRKDFRILGSECVSVSVSVSENPMAENSGTENWSMI